jgi:PAS domain S-box-containing protein
LTENALKESEETFRTVANYTNDWEFWIDQQGNFQYCSPSCEEITGYSAAEFLQNPRLLSDIVFPDDQIVFQYHKQMEEALIDVHQEIQFRIIKANGQIRWVGHVCKYVFDEIGNYTGIRGSNRDITKRKETEHELKTSKRKYKLLSLNITDGVFICKNAKFDYVNKGMNAIFGYEYSELKGKPFLDLILPLFHENLDSFVNNNSHTNQILNIEIECYKKDLSIIVVEVFLNYVADEKSIYGVAHDITEKKHIQKKNILKAIIQTEEKEKAHFSKELHDGIGPLLSTIKLYLQWTIRLKSIKKRNEIILKAEAIVEDALETVKEISNKLSPHLLANYGLTSALQSFTNKIGETTAINITVESNVSRRIDVEIEAAIYRAMIECINNTIKYANATNIYILLNDIGSQIQINYRDNGIGFNLEETKAAQKGLGLFNLQNRIQTIGGEIEMHSEIGQGVNYQFIVPL